MTQKKTNKSVVFANINESNKRGDFSSVSNNQDIFLQFFQPIIDNIPAGIAVFDGIEFRLKWANSFYLSLLYEPYKSNFVAGMRLQDYAPNAEENGLVDLFHRVVETGLPDTNQEYKIIDAMGNITYWQHSIVPIPSENDISDIMISLINITEQVTARNQFQNREELFRLLYETMQLGIVHYDAEGKIISANPAVQQILGLTPDELYGKTSIELENYCVYEDGVLFPGNQHPSMIALNTGCEVKDVVMGIYNSCEKERRWININAVPLFKENESKPYQVYTHFYDITDKKKAKEALENAIIELNIRARELEIKNEELAISNEEIAAMNEELQVSNKELQMEVDQRMQAEQALRQTEEKYRTLVELSPEALFLVRNDEIIFINLAGQQLLGASCADNILKKSPKAFFHLDCHSIISRRTKRLLSGKTVPLIEQTILRLDGKLVNVEVATAAIFDSEGPAIQYVLRNITERKKIDKARFDLLNRERHIAETLQQTLVPTDLPCKIGNFSIGAKHKSALNEAEIGGDFYDIFDLGNGKIGVLIGDVAGKGLSAAIRVSAARYSLRNFAYIVHQPSKAMSLANKSLCKDSDDESGILTAFFAVMDIASGKVTYTSAGHEPPLVCHASGAVEELQFGGMPLGITESTVYTQVNLYLKPKDTLIMITDGITEARNSDKKLFEKNGIIKYMAGKAFNSPDEIASELIETTINYTGGHLQDDIAAVVIRFDNDDQLRNQNDRNNAA